METRRRQTIQQDGRAKAYRPLDEATRRAALTDGLEAYERGDFFLAHENLEPASTSLPSLAGSTSVSRRCRVTSRPQPSPPTRRPSRSPACLRRRRGHLRG